MKVSPILACAAIAVLSQGVVGWTNEDHEIFDIVSALEVAEGKGTTFYSFLNVTKSATEKDISKSYRKRSLELHPDKNPNDSVIADRFARLGTIAGILRDAEKRKRYDHFYDNGVPRWRGTGYYYSRYRPGLGAVVGALVVFSCFIQYVYLSLLWYVSVQRIKQFQVQALEYAWGPTKKPLAGRKRIKVKTGDTTGLGLPGINNGRPLVPGQVIEMIVEGEQVYVVEKGEENLLEESAAVYPALKDTWIPSLAHTLYLRATGQAPSPTAIDSDDETTTEVVVGKDGKETIVAVKKPKGPMKGVEGLGKIGGRRRKTVPKRKEA